MPKKILIICAALFFFTTLTGCQKNTTPSPTNPTPSTNPNAPRTLTICLGYEPKSLYLYSASSQAEWSVLEAIYDGPIDILKYEPVPVILDILPTLKNGGVNLISVNVKSGDNVVDIRGNPVVLERGVEVFPHGCTETQCAIHWDGVSDLQMDQLSATFRLLPGINWTDGHPLKAIDSVYSFHLAEDPATPINKKSTLQTSSYVAKDDLTIEWKGKPGLLTQSFENYFWLPLPQHAWGKYSSSELLTNENSTRRPIGWGPYILQEWQPGKFIRLTKNPGYFRASQGLPKFDTLIFKFINVQGDTNLMAIRHGECDLANQTALWLDQTERLELYLKYYSIPEVKSFFGNGPSIEYIIFNTQPINDKQISQSSLMANLQLRQAVAYCLDRPGIYNNFFNRLIQIPLTYFPQANPYYNNTLAPHPYDPEKGQAILDNMGWTDTDRNPQTPRKASNVTGVADGIPLTLRLIADQSVWRRNVANNMARSLQKCGFGVELTILKENEYLARQGPFWEGNFDLAEFAWSSGKIPPCYLLSTTAQAILDKPLNSPDYNVGKYHNPEFDQLCLASLQSMVDSGKQMNLQNEMQNIIHQDIPILPLFAYFQADVARADFCPFELDFSARSDLWNIESLDYGLFCAPIPNR